MTASDKREGRVGKLEGRWFGTFVASWKVLKLAESECANFWEEEEEELVEGG